MGGRGTFAAGNPVPYTYKTVGKIEGVKVLEGLNGKHSLPESAHSSTAYIKLNPDGTFREMRFYDKQHRLYLEIGYHPEKNLGSPEKPILHYHTYDPTFSTTKIGNGGRSKAIKLPGGMKRKLRKYFKGGRAMINGDPHDFIDHIYSGQDTPYRFGGEKFWYQGFCVEEGFRMEIFRCNKPYDFIWQYTGASPLECLEKFQEAPLFDGKCFWNAEQDIEWLDE